MLSPKHLQRQANVNSVADRPRTRDRRRDYEIVQAVTAMLADGRALVGVDGAPMVMLEELVAAARANGDA